MVKILIISSSTSFPPLSRKFLFLKGRTEETTFMVDNKNNWDNQLTLFDSHGEKLINLKSNLLCSKQGREYTLDSQILIDEKKKIPRKLSPKQSRNKVISPSSKTLLHNFVHYDQDAKQVDLSIKAMAKTARLAQTLGMQLRYVEYYVNTSNQTLAAKPLKFVGCRTDIDLFREVQIMSYAQHRNVVLLIGFCIDGDKKVLDICNGSSDFRLLTWKQESLSRLAIPGKNGNLSSTRLAIPS